jgi:hypothetical protein
MMPQQIAITPKIYSDIRENWSKFSAEGWQNIASNYCLSLHFIEEFEQCLPSVDVIVNQNVDIAFIERHMRDDDLHAFLTKDHIGNNLIQAGQIESFLAKHADALTHAQWAFACQFQKLSESFIREFRYQVDWRFISAFQTLSESFIREFQHQVDWHYVSICQTLSEGFICEFKDKVNWKNVQYEQQLSSDFLRSLGFKNVYWTY